MTNCWYVCCIECLAKQSFYVYAFVLSVLNLIQAIGSAIFFMGHVEGLCVVDVTTYVYFTLFTPLVYWTFLAQFFSTTHSVIMFSYKPQLDDNLDEHMSNCGPVDDTCGSDTQIPHQLSCSSLKTDTEFVFQRNNALYESTQFTASVSLSANSPTTPTSASLSPDSITSNHSLN